MKKKEIITLLISMSLVLLAISSLYLCPRLFSDDESRAMYNVKDILCSFISPKSDDIVDFTQHIFRSGSYEYGGDGELYLSLAIKTDADIMDALSIIPLMNNEINTCINNNSILSDEKTELNIRIEYWGDWVIILKPKLNYISIGLTEQYSMTEILDCCKSFTEIHIGGYWGHTVLIPNNINGDYFSNFPHLNVLSISDIATIQMKEHLNEIASDLRSRGVTVTMDVR